MSDEQIRRSLQLQDSLSRRLAELAYADIGQAERISRQLAEIASRGKIIAETTVPLFLDIAVENKAALAQVALALRLQLQELFDTLNDAQADLADWEEFFRSFI